MPVLSWQQVAAVAIAGGWPPGPAVVATAITGCESGRNSTIVQAGQPYSTTGWGLWQITPGNSVPQFGIDNALLDPLNNAKAGHYKWARAGGFSPWTTFEDGCYDENMAEATAAVEAVSHMSAAALSREVAAARKGGGVASGLGSGFLDWSPHVRKTRGHVHTSARHWQGYGQGIEGLRPVLRKPKEHVPDASSVLWHLSRRTPDV